MGDCNGLLDRRSLPSLDPMMACRRRVPAMGRAMPIDVNSTEMLTRLGLAHAGRGGIRRGRHHQNRHNKHPDAHGVAPLNHRMRALVPESNISGAKV